MSSKSAKKRRTTRKQAADKKPLRPKATYVKLFNAALDEDPQTGDIILRGSLDPSTLDAILYDDYQREILPSAKINEIMEGFKEGGSVPDVDLGMRGIKTKDDGTNYVLLSNVYGIDGKQRIAAAIEWRDSGHIPKLGATVHFNTNKIWETERFRILNALRSKVSANVLLRNKKDQLTVIDLLYKLCLNDPAFVLRKRVCWQNNKQRDHLLTARTLALSILNLHSHYGGLATQIDPIANNLQKICDRVGRNIFRDNVRGFFQLIEGSWGITTVTYANAPHLKNTFIFALARVLSNHPVFWRDTKLFVEKQLSQKIKQFNTQDPVIKDLASSGGAANAMLYRLLIDHINSGKRTKRLVPRVEEDEFVESLDKTEETEE
jgi:hypothetical protein